MKKIIFLILMSLILSSCLVNTKNPITENKLEVDKDLRGLWQSQDSTDDSKNGFMIILEDKNAVYSFIPVNDDYKMDFSYQAFISKVGNDNYLNMQPLNVDADTFNVKDEYFLAYYEIKNTSTLYIYLLSEPNFENAIKQKQLKGKITSDKYNTTTIMITDSSENIYNYIKNQKKEDLFGSDPMIFKRANLP